MKHTAQVINFQKSTNENAGNHSALTEREVCERAKRLGLYVCKSKRTTPYIYDHAMYKLVFKEWKKVVIAGHEYQLTLEILSEIMDRYEENTSLIRTICEMTAEDRIGVQVNIDLCVAAIDASYNLRCVEVDNINDSEIPALYAQFNDAVQKLSLMTKCEFDYTYGVRNKSTSNEVLGNRIFDELRNLYIERNRDDKFISNLISVSERMVRIIQEPGLYSSFKLLADI